MFLILREQIISNKGDRSKYTISSIHYSITAITGKRNIFKVTVEYFALIPWPISSGYFSIGGDARDGGVVGAWPGEN